MRNKSREWIAIGFNGDIKPVLQVDGSNGLKKTIKGISGIDKMMLYHIDFENKISTQIGCVCFPQDISKVDIIIDFIPDNETGTVEICQTDQVWNYSLNDSSNDKSENPVCKENVPSVLMTDPIADTKNVVDKDIVRQIEQQKKTRTVWPDELAEELKRDIYGQDEVIQKISELISANLRRRIPEVVVIVLFGPTGVGKTEVGKALPRALEKLSGQKYGFHQIALNEFIGDHYVNRFFGSPPSYIGYKDPTVFEPVRSNPYQVYLLDEIEKATDRIYTGLMECFSSGVVRLADNSPEIDLSHVIFIITSNIPINMGTYDKASPFQKKEICRNALAEACGHPEIAGKIANCLAFRELSVDALTDIVSKFVVEELRNYEMKLVHIDEELMVQLKEQHSEYGARGVKDVVREAIMAATVYDREIERYKGKEVALSGNIDSISISIVSKDD